MTWKLKGTHAEEGDLAQLVSLSHKNFIIRLKSGDVFQSHRGIIPHKDLIGLEWGSQVFSHKGSPFYLVQPSFSDLLIETPRSTQILYPKDIGFIMVNLGVGPGMHVVEAGSGSGALTSAFAYAVGESGRVASYEIKEEIQKRAIKNLTRLGMQDRVDFKVRNISEGFDERSVDVLFLDVPDPHNYISQVKETLKPGGFFGTILPTTNQISLLLIELKRHAFIYIEVCEILLRYYKPEPARFRPVDRMIAHTGFLIFARPVIKAPAEENDEAQDTQDVQDEDILDRG